MKGAVEEGIKQKFQDSEGVEVPFHKIRSIMGVVDLRRPAKLEREQKLPTVLKITLKVINAQSK